MMTRAFYRMTPASPEVACIAFGLFDTVGGGTEAGMDWIQLWGHDKPVPRLNIFDDAWELLPQFADVWAALAKVDDQNITPEQFIAILKECGFKDFGGV
jgi:hypothetical protein